MDLATLYGVAKGFSLIKNNSGVLTVNARVFINEPSFNLGIGSKIIFLGTELELQTVTVPSGSVYKDLTFTNYSILDSYDFVIPRDIEWRTIPRSLFDTTKFTLLNTISVPPTGEPDVDMRVKTVENLYSSGGWDTETILRDVMNVISEEFGFVDIIIPPIINYDITEFKVREGSPLTSILSGLFPIPGLNINKINRTIYVSVPRDFFAIDGACHIISDSELEQRSKYKITGQGAEPKNVLWEDPDRIIDINVSESEYFGYTLDDFNVLLPDGDVSTLKIKLNLMGGIFGLLERTVTGISSEKWIGMNELLEKITVE